MHAILRSQHSFGNRSHHRGRKRLLFFTIPFVFVPSGLWHCVMQPLEISPHLRVQVSWSRVLHRCIKVHISWLIFIINILPRHTTLLHWWGSAGRLGRKGNQDPKDLQEVLQATTLQYRLHQSSPGSESHLQATSYVDHWSTISIHVSAQPLYKIN